MAPGLGLGNSVTADPASTLFASTPPLLETYPNAHRAYSMRKLRTEYTGYALKIREGSGMNYTADVAFDDDGWVSLDSKVYNRSDSGTNGVTLSSFLSGYSNPALLVTVWYDQSGEGVNATQGTANAQPMLSSGSGSLITEGSPARASLLFDGSNDYLFVDEAGLSMGSLTATAVISHASTSASPVWSLSFSSGAYFVHYIGSGPEDQYWYDTGDVASHSANTSQKLFSYTSGSGTDQQILYSNGTPSSEKGDSSASASLHDYAHNGLGTIYTYSLFYNGEFQEYIVWDSDQRSNLSGIESEINTAYSIY